jgi:peptide/nickel transport system permease protein
MWRYLATRLGLSCITLVGISVIVFSLARISGDVVSTLIPPESQTDPAQYQHLKQALGLNRSYPEQYLLWVGNALHGDFGQSIRFHQGTFSLFTSRFPNTLELAGVAGVIALAFGVSSGVASALHPRSLLARGVRLFALLGQSVPSFFVGVLLILLFAVKLRWLPTSGMSGAKSYIMPAVSLAWFATASLSRVTRSAMLDVLDRDHIKLARLNGVDERSIIWRHALRNAFAPILTFFSLQLLVFISGSVVVERIFTWPGIGQLSIEAITSRDYPLIQTIVLVTSVLVVCTNLAVDLAYAALDPRIRFGVR